MCRFSAEGLSALGEFTSKKAAFLKLPWCGTTLCKTSWLCAVQRVAGSSGMGHLWCVYNPNNLCSAVLLLTALCFMVGTAKNTNRSCTRFNFTQQIHSKTISGTGSKRGSLFAEICAAWFSPADSPMIQLWLLWMRKISLLFYSPTEYGNLPSFDGHGTPSSL